VRLISHVPSVYMEDGFRAPGKLLWVVDDCQIVDIIMQGIYVDRIEANGCAHLVVHVVLLPAATIPG
jgi:hypothetical protein